MNEHALTSHSPTATQNFSFALGVISWHPNSPLGGLNMQSLVCVVGPITNDCRTHVIRRIRSIYPVSFFFFVLSLTMLPSLAMAADVPDASYIGQVCFAVADERDLGPQDPDNDQDTLTLLKPATGETQVIGTTGTHNVEALTFGPH